MSNPSESGRRAQGRWSPGRRVWFGVFLLCALVGVGYGAFVFVVRASHALLPGNGLRAPGPLSDLPGLDTAEEPTSRVNILVMGIDHRPGKPNEYLPATPNAPTDPGRSDTMAVVSVDPATKSAALLSIPRDLWLEVPDGHGGWTMDRINEPYHTGEIHKVPGGGPALAAAAITHNFGIPIDYYVDVDFNGFMALADAIGGIDLDVPARLTATVLPRANTGAYEYTFFPGPQHLNGELALAYARFRLNDEGDFGRIKRQQAVVLAARQKAMSLGWIDHPLDVWQKYSSTLSTNIPPYKLPGLALLAKQIGTSAITARSLGEPGAVNETVIPGTGADVLFPDPVAASRIVAESFGDPAYGASTLAQLQRLYPPGGRHGAGSARGASIAGTGQPGPLGQGPDAAEEVGGAAGQSAPLLEPPSR